MEALVNKKKAVAIIIAALLFGALMSVREMTPNIWLRALIAGIAAGSSFSLFHLIARKGRSVSASVPLPPDRRPLFSDH